MREDRTERGGGDGSDVGTSCGDGIGGGGEVGRAQDMTGRETWLVWRVGLSYNRKQPKKHADIISAMSDRTFRIKHVAVTQPCLLESSHGVSLPVRLADRWYVGHGKNGILQNW